MRNLPVALADRQHAARVVEPRGQPGQCLVAHQHQVLDLRLMHRRSGIEAARAVLDREQPVAREVAAGRQRRPRQGLGRETLHRVAVEGGDGQGGTAHAPCLAGFAARGNRTRMAPVEASAHRMSRDRKFEGAPLVLPICHTTWGRPVASKKGRRPARRAQTREGEPAVPHRLVERAGGPAKEERTHELREIHRAGAGLRAIGAVAGPARGPSAAVARPRAQGAARRSRGLVRRPDRPGRRPVARGAGAEPRRGWPSSRRSRAAPRSRRRPAS